MPPNGLTAPVTVSPRGLSNWVPRKDQGFRCVLASACHIPLCPDCIWIGQDHLGGAWVFLRDHCGTPHSPSTVQYLLACWWAPWGQGLGLPSLPAYLQGPTPLLVPKDLHSQQINHKPQFPPPSGPPHHSSISWICPISHWWSHKRAPKWRASSFRNQRFLGPIWSSRPKRWRSHIHAWTFLFLFLRDDCQIFQLEKVGREILNANGLWQVEWLSGSYKNKPLCPLPRREGGKVSARRGRFIFVGQVFLKFADGNFICI